MARVTVTIRNPADPDRAWEGLFLVDTGTTDSLVPRPHLESIGLRPKGRRVYELADGSEITMEITTAVIEFMGETVGGTILFGEAAAAPLLGATALASVGIELDPNNQRLKRRPAVRLKALREPSRHSIPPPSPRRSRESCNGSARRFPPPGSVANQRVPTGEHEG